MEEAEKYFTQETTSLVPHGNKTPKSRKTPAKKDGDASTIRVPIEIVNIRREELSKMSMEELLSHLIAMKEAQEKFLDELKNADKKPDPNIALLAEKAALEAKLLETEQKAAQAISDKCHYEGQFRTCEWKLQNAEENNRHFQSRIADLNRSANNAEEKVRSLESDLHSSKLHETSLEETMKRLLNAGKWLYEKEARKAKVYKHLADHYEDCVRWLKEGWEGGGKHGDWIYGRFHDRWYDYLHKQAESCEMAKDVYFTEWREEVGWHE